MERDNMKKLIAGLMVLAVGTALAAPALRQLPWQTAVQYGATHVLEVDYTDLTGYTATNTTVAFTNTVNAPCSVEFRAMVLDQAFDSTSYTNALSMLCNAGYTTDDDLWLDDKQVAADGTEIRNSFGGDYTVATVTTTIGPDTNLLVSASTSTVATPLLNEQASDVSLVTSFGPPVANKGHDILTSGRVRLFFRILN
jgi:hypothetical protein